MSQSHTHMQTGAHLPPGESTSTCVALDKLTIHCNTQNGCNKHGQGTPPPFPIATSNSGPRVEVFDPTQLSQVLLFDALVMRVIKF